MSIQRTTRTRTAGTALRSPIHCATLFVSWLVLVAGGTSGLPPQDPTGAHEDEAVAARGKESVLLWKELDPLLLQRHAMSKDGRAALRHLAESRLLELLERELGVAASEDTVRARRDELDQQILASGDAAGIGGYLRKARLSEAEFLRFLRLSFVQETLTRRALALPDGAPVNGEQQQIWIDEELAARKYVEPVPPWKDGVVARASGFEIGTVEFARCLRRRLPADDVEDDCYQVLLHRRMLARMPDLAPEKLRQYVDKEIERRRSEASADPRYKGIAFEKLLASQGIAPDSLARDPAVLVAALSRLWVDRSYSDEALRRVYSSEREYFDGLYGEAIDTSLLFLRASQFKNELNPRTFAEAQTELSEIGTRIATKEDFQRIAREKSEDAGSRDQGGALGYVTVRTPGLPPEIQAEVARRLAAPRPGVEPATTAPLVGPLRLANGCVLVWFGARRPSPNWESMSAHVHRELRKRFIDDVLPRASLVTTFDAE